METYSSSLLLSDIELNLKRDAGNSLQLNTTENESSDAHALR